MRLGAALALIGVAAYGAVASATPPSGVSNPPWSPVIGRFPRGLDATAKTDINPGSATDFWQMRIQAKDVMSSLSDPTCRDLLSSSAERVRAGLVTVELEEAPCEHRNGT
jgi:hypothetical protein